jgi:hypothetical protein
VLQALGHEEVDGPAVATGVQLGGVPVGEGGPTKSSSEATGELGPAVGSGRPGPRHLDVSFSWQSDGQWGSLLPAHAYGSVDPEGSGFPSFCQVLSPCNA